MPTMYSNSIALEIIQTVSHNICNACSTWGKHIIPLQHIIVQNTERTKIKKKNEKEKVILTNLHVTSH
jgi:hypothetical protein